MDGVVKGYKVFNPDWTCRGKQYACPGKFEEDVELSVCGRGMDFCGCLADCFKYYDFDPNNKAAEVVAYGKVVMENNKYVTNKLEIVREIPWEEVIKLVNSGNYNSGYRNSGNHNSGNRNSGDYNSGNYNSGYRNSGNYNSGNYNSGDWNKCDFSNGCFNTGIPKIYMFNKISDWTYTDWLKSRARHILSSMPYGLDYIYLEDMTEEEIKNHPEAEVTGGYLKQTDRAEEIKEWWSGLSEEEKECIKSLPNFNPDIFKEITGIDVKLVTYQYALSKK